MVIQPLKMNIVVDGIGRPATESGDIPVIMGNSHDHVYYILTQELDMEKLCVRWMLHLSSAIRMMSGAFFNKTMHLLTQVFL